MMGRGGVDWVDWFREGGRRWGAVKYMGWWHTSGPHTALESEETIWYAILIVSFHMSNKRVHYVHGISPDGAPLMLWRDGSCWRVGEILHDWKEKLLKLGYVYSLVRQVTCVLRCVCTHTVVAYMAHNSPSDRSRTLFRGYDNIADILSYIYIALSRISHFHNIVSYVIQCMI